MIHVILAPLSQANIQSYEIYWAQGTGGEPTPLQLLQSLPMASVQMVTVVFEMRDSWGDGWNGAYFYIKQNGVTIASGTFTSGYASQDTIPNLPTGQALTITVTPGSYPYEMSWSLRYESGEQIMSSSDASTVTHPVDQPFTLSSGSGSSGGMVEVNISANIPAGADHLLTFAALTSGTNSLAAWTSIVDFQPPAHPPSSIQFTDTDYSAGVIAGTLSIGRASSETDISHYNIYFGASSTQKLPAQGLPGLVYELFVFAQGSTLPSFDGRQPTSQGVHTSLFFSDSNFGCLACQLKP